MALGRARRRERSIDYWPGFVDVLSTMLLVMIFLLSVFMLAQFFLTRDVSGKDAALSRLNRQVQELGSILALERAGRAEAEANAGLLKATLETVERDKSLLVEDKARLQTSLDDIGRSRDDMGRAVAEAGNKLTEEQTISARALAEVEILNQQIAALRQQLGALEATLAASEGREREAQEKVTDLGARLNLALAQKVQELGRYRSDFFGRLQEILGNRPEIRVAGDRFILQSEVLFRSGQAKLDPAGRGELDKVANALLDLDRAIPAEIGWVLRVDGHTDRRPIQSAQFSSNWALSTARALAVVQYLISKGVPAQRLAAAGFGEFHPLEEGEGEEANRRNRRIEFKITEK
jgi:chemotaxis protein MotB